MIRWDKRRRLLAWAAASAILAAGDLLRAGPGWTDHGPGVPIQQHAPHSADESAIVCLVRTVAEGWERKDVDLLASAYAPDAVQRAWNDPGKMAVISRPAAAPAADPPDQGAPS